MNKKIRVLVVDDSNLVREMVSSLLNQDAEIEVIGTAADAQEARTKIKELNPDVVTLDIEMPGMDGISFLEKIMTLRPTPVIMLSTLTQRGAEHTIRALEIGAVDCVGKPYAQENKETFPLLQNQLINKVKMASKANLQVNKNISKPNFGNTDLNKLDYSKIIAVGSSTGGVEAIKNLIETLPNTFPPIVITQHMPEGFVTSFVQRLAKTLGKNVLEAQEGMALEANTIYIAPGNRHLEVSNKAGKGVIHLSDAEPCSGHRPSVDVMFNSVALAFGEKAVGVILTGMGRDGADGLFKMKQAGAYTIGQSEESCVVYGMPKAAKSLNALNIELPIEKIGATIIKNCIRN